MKKLLLLFAFCFITFSLWAEPNINQNSSEKAGMSWGLKLMHLDFEKSDFYIASLPAFEYQSQLFIKGLNLYTATNITWGLSDFFMDFGFGTGLRYYPLGNRSLSFYAGGEAATFFFNNATLTGRVGSDIDFNINHESSVFLGAELFQRKVYRLVEYIDSSHWYISSRGWAINGGFRVRFNLVERGLKELPKTL
ncbi:MAG: hypothetical protein PF637_05145 [Spirochaetes bacterium]|jgi:hypothetical protein|nr:hypothetical protein [Spirochaetota bacterium]